MKKKVAILIGVALLVPLFSYAATPTIQQQLSEVINRLGALEARVSKLESVRSASSQKSDLAEVQKLYKVYKSTGCTVVTVTTRNLTRPTYQDVTAKSSRNTDIKKCRETVTALEPYRFAIVDAKIPELLMALDSEH